MFYFRGIVVITACLVFVSCSNKNKDGKSAAKANKVSYIEGYVVKPSVLEEGVNVSGTVKPYEETVLMSDVSGRVVAINFQEGSYVKKGTLLVQLFNDDLQAQLHKLQSTLDIAQQTEKRQAELMAVNGISKQSYDEAVLHVHSVKADIEVVQAQIRKTMIVAPFDGYVGLRNVSVGAVVTPSTAIATIRQVDQLKLEFSLPGKYAGMVKSGSKVKFNIQGIDGQFEARVVATEEGVDLNTRNLKAKALVISKNKNIVPGMYADVQIQIRDNAKALMVPTQALIPQERNKKIIVARQGKAAFLVVKTGIRQEGAIEVVEGINIGDTVVTSGILFVKPGAELNFAKVN